MSEICRAGSSWEEEDRRNSAARAVIYCAREEGRESDDDRVEVKACDVDRAVKESGVCHVGVNDDLDNNRTLCTWKL